METITNLRPTGDIVLESRKYRCVNGEVRRLQKGERFPRCSRTGGSTIWRYADFSTGDSVTITGHYINKEGEHIVLKRGNIFPNCPKTGKPSIWKRV